MLTHTNQADLTPEEVAKLHRQTCYRWRKQFSRARLLQAHAKRCRADVCERHSTAGRAEDVRRAVSVPDWRLLTQLADGQSYEALAAERNVSVGALKSYVSRLRDEVRRQCQPK